MFKKITQGHKELFSLLNALRHKKIFDFFVFNDIKTLCLTTEHFKNKSLCAFVLFFSSSKSPQQNSLDLCKRYFYARSSAEFYSG